MALKLRKEMKKSSYYVWFLGAKEARGLRGIDAIMPALEHLVQREKDTEPHKVTLQVSQKGLKIVQNVVRETGGSGKSAKPKLETVKHLIPSDSVAFSHQRDDVVACVLLLMNPVTGWPLHVHAYRCDSLDTARLLHHQLQSLSQRPDNQKRWQEVETKIVDKEMKEIGRQDSSLGSEAGASSARGSDSGEERLSGGLCSDLPPLRTSILYDSVAAELRARLGGISSGVQSRSPSQPLLLPPRDYDTMHRQRGNLQGIELRRCLNANIVGRSAAATSPSGAADGSIASSGIGSDHASPSPGSPSELAPFGNFDGNSTSDEEWNADTAESTMYLMSDGSPELTLPRPQTQNDIRSSRHYQDHKTSRYASTQNVRTNALEMRYPEDSRTLEKNAGRFMDNKYVRNFKDLEEQHNLSKNFDQKNHADFLTKKGFESKRELVKREFERRDLEKRDFERMDLEKREYERRQHEKRETDKKNFEKVPRFKYVSDNKDDEFKMEIKNAVRYRREADEMIRKPRYTFGEERYIEEHIHEPRKSHNELYQEEFKRMHEDFSNYKLSDHYDREMTRRKTDQDRAEDEKYYRPYTEQSRSSEKSYYSRHSQEEYTEEVEIKRRPELRQRTPSPLDDVSPKDRFKDAKEKFLLMEKERLEEERIRIAEPPISPTRRDRGGYSREDVLINPTNKINHLETKDTVDKYFSSGRYDSDDLMFPKPAPRKHMTQEVPLRRAEAPVERYRMGDKYDPKRRSMFNLTEEEHRRTCNEIAMELKMRSYLDCSGQAAYEEEIFREADRAFHELPESDRYTRIEQQQLSRSSADLDRLGDMKQYDSRFLKKEMGKNRHSYAEPKFRLERGSGHKQYPEMLQRTNSSVSCNNGRVGIASVHPY